MDLVVRPIWYVVLEMDFCSRTFGTSPCLATGEKCFNTFPTCKYLSAYLNTGKDYEFSSSDAPLPFDGPRPYIQTVDLLPTEIKTNLTVTGRVYVKFHDEPDGDVGIDPYVTSRSSFPNIPGTFWKKWLVRNKNYKGRRIKVYEGKYGDAKGAFSLRWVGKLEDADYGGGVLSLEATDLLKDLSKIDIPAKLDIKLNANVSAALTTLYVTPGSALDSSGTIRVDDEVITYTGYTSATGEITGATRGAYGTTAAEHSAKGKVQKCKVYAKQNPIDCLKSILLTDAGIPSADVDTTAFTTVKTFPVQDLDIGPVVISEPTKASKLYFELLELVNCKSWQNESNQITIARDVGSVPLSTVADLSDAFSVEGGSVKQDLNEGSRLTRVWLYWDKTVLGKEDEPSSYGRIDLGISAGSESADSYGDEVEKKIFSRWLVSAGQVEEEVQAFARNVCGRILARYVDASPILTFSVAPKDETLKTGDLVSLTTDELLDIYGQDSTSFYRVVKRVKTSKGVSLSLLRGPSRRIAHVAPSAYAYDYLTAPAADQLKYGFVAGSDGRMSNGDLGYFAY